MKKLVNVESHDGQLTGFLLYQRDETVLLEEIGDFRWTAGADLETKSLSI